MESVSVSESDSANVNEPQQTTVIKLTTRQTLNSSTDEQKYYLLTFITGRNEVVAKVMFLHVCVILFTGGVSGQGENPTTPPPGRENPPWSRHPPQDQTPLGPDPPGPDPPPGSRLQHTVNERPVRILLECILVQKDFSRFLYGNFKCACFSLEIIRTKVLSIQPYLHKNLVTIYGNK